MDVNLVWIFVENAMVGEEYLMGFREDINDNEGTANLAVPVSG